MDKKKLSIEAFISKFSSDEFDKENYYSDYVNNLFSKLFTSAEGQIFKDENNENSFVNKFSEEDYPF